MTSPELNYLKIQSILVLLKRDGWGEKRTFWTPTPPPTDIFLSQTKNHHNLWHKEIYEDNFEGHIHHSTSFYVYLLRVPLSASASARPVPHIYTNCCAINFIFLLNILPKNIILPENIASLAVCVNGVSRGAGGSCIQGTCAQSHDGQLNVFMQHKKKTLCEQV